jgi:hypothetical protein
MPVMRDEPSIGGGAEFSVFAAARFGTRAGGGWAALTSTGGAEEWDRYAQGGNRVRADRRPGTADVPLPDHVGVRPLPYYVGPRGLFRTLPARVRRGRHRAAGAGCRGLARRPRVPDTAATLCRRGHR